MDPAARPTGQSLSVAAQEGDPASTLEFYRTALAARRQWARDATAEVSTSRSTATCCVVRRGPVTVACNCGDWPVPVPAGEVLVASGPVGTTLPPDTAAWFGSASQLGSGWLSAAL